jgi:hypothetical protein
MKTVKVLWGSALVICATWLVAGCGVDTSRVEVARMARADHPCVVTPLNCSSDIFRQLYLAAPGTTYAKSFGAHRLNIPVGYVDAVQVLADRHDPIAATLNLEMLMPGFLPHSPQNLRSFIAPDHHNKLWVTLGVHAPEFLKRGQRAGQGKATFCDVEVDGYAADRAMVISPVDHAELVGEPKQWVEHELAMCDHYMVYPPLGAYVRMSFSRRYLAQRSEIERHVRRLLDDSLAKAG